LTDISAQNIHKHFGALHVLRGVSFDIHSGEHAGLLGRNGAGKTVLLRILAGQETPENGPDPALPASVSFPKGKSVGLLSQIPSYPAEYTGLDVLHTAFAELRELESAMRGLEASLTDAELARYGQLRARYDFLEGFTAPERLARARQGLDLPDGLVNRPFASLSGGERTRVNLARLILQNTDILLLDEPTNHLDVKSAEWLEAFIARYKGTILCVSHDRYFLDACVTRVLELEDGVIAEYSGNYTFYAAEKARRREEQAKQYEASRRETQRLQATARRMHDYAGNNAALHKRAFAIEKRAARIPAVAKPRAARSVKAGFTESAFRASDLLALRGVTFGYPGAGSLFTGVDLAVNAGERVAVAGPNGAGKTTLFRLLLGQLAPGSGTIKLGPSARLGYLPQAVAFEDEGRSLIDTLIYEAGCSAQEAQDRLGAFLFGGEDRLKTAGALSGGERSRLMLCLLMAKGVNLLLLDEPTNHLDIAGREWVEGAVERYGQTLLFISHDRWFLSRFATRVWELAGGRVRDYPGGDEE
jgi:ATPase subunit of ABC transporter with duplicated ATPase domains